MAKRSFKRNRRNEGSILNPVIDQAELIRHYDEDEMATVESPRGGEWVCSSQEPWELPNFSLEEARAIGAAAAELIESGGWEAIEKCILEQVGTPITTPHT